MPDPRSEVRHVGVLGRIARRGVLVVEPDPLTQWSLRMYLGKWFDVETVGDAEAALRTLAERRVEVLIVAEELSVGVLAEQIRQEGERMQVIRTVTDPARCGRLEVEEPYLEKPFELARLATMLGIPSDELPVS